jgi:hypothetical protein
VDKLLTVAQAKGSLKTLEERGLEGFKARKAVLRWKALGPFGPLPYSIVLVILFNVVIAILLDPRRYLPLTDFNAPCPEQEQRFNDLAHELVEETNVEAAEAQVDRLWVIGSELDQLVTICEEHSEAAALALANKDQDKQCSETQTKDVVRARRLRLRHQASRASLAPRTLCRSRACLRVCVACGPAVLQALGREVTSVPQSHLRFRLWLPGVQ